jgi:hypothetical protein
MNGLGILILIFPPMVLFFIGYLVRFRKMYWLISGYNTMSADKKKNVDTENLGILMGNMCFILGCLLFIGFLFISLEAFIAGYIVLALIFPVIIFTIIIAQKYDGNTRTDSNKMKTSAKIVVGIIVISLLVLLGFVGSMLFKDMQPITVSLEPDSLRIDGSYGQEILYTDILEIQIIDALPEIQRRTNGSAAGTVLRGHFLLSQVGQAMLYLDREKPPFIYLATSEQKIYLHAATPELTRDLFDSLSAKCMR